MLLDQIARARPAVREKPRHPGAGLRMEANISMSLSHQLPKNSPAVFVVNHQLPQ